MEGSADEGLGAFGGGGDGCGCGSFEEFMVKEGRETSTIYRDVSFVQIIGQRKRISLLPM